MNPRFSDQIEAEDLVFDNGDYNPRNKWNGSTDTGTIAHLIQRNNTLPAEIQIAADATVLRRDASYGRLMTNIIELCGKGSAYGNDKRNSDPVVSMTRTVYRYPLIGTHRSGAKSTHWSEMD